MKGRAKDRAKKIALIVIFTILVVLITSLIIGRAFTEKIVIVSKEGIETGMPLEDQLEYFDEIEISKDEFKKFNGQVATSKAQLRGKMTLYDLAPGTPLTRSSITDYANGGVFAAKMPEGRTAHLLVNAKVGLPPVENGDKVNVILLYKEKDDDGNEQPVISLLMSGVKIYNTSETDLYLDVTVEESLVLDQAAQLGTFIIQIPGKDADSKEALKDYNFETTVTVNDLLSAIESGKYHNENRVFAGQVKKAVDKLNSKDATEDKKTKKESDTQDGSVKEDGK